MKKYVAREFSVKFREWSYCRELSRTFLEHLRIWCFGKWYKSNTCDIWESSGFRLLGLSFSKREYISQEYRKYLKKKREILLSEIDI